MAMIVRKFEIQNANHGGDRRATLFTTDCTDYADENDRSLSVNSVLFVVSCQLSVVGCRLSEGRGQGNTNGKSRRGPPCHTYALRLTGADFGPVGDLRPDSRFGSWF